MRRTTPGVFALAPSASVLPWPAEVIEEALSPLILPERLARFEAIARARLRSVVMVLESVIDPHNTAAVLRTSDAFGVGEIHLVDRGVRPLMAQRITKGCDRWLDLHVHRDSTACAMGLRARGYEVFVADVRATMTLDEVAARPNVAMVFGNEHEGASAEMRAASSGTFTIPMRGMVESLNVSVAAGIALHAVTRGRAGDLGESETRALKARFLIESVREHELVIERHLRERRSGA
jgi:tRNA (guanosine-2'-O-)-methyltransferase